MEKISRKHYLELHEKEWCPKVLRRHMLSSLAFGWAFTLKKPRFLKNKFLSKVWDGFVFSAADAAIHPLKKGLELTNSNVVLDLCSGAGGPIASLSEKLGSSSNIKFYLSDIIPCKNEWHILKNKYKNIDFIDESVDATKADKYFGFRLLSCCLHHFRPKDAISIIQNSVDNSQGILIMEMTERTILGMFMMIFNCQLSTFLSAIFVRPFSYSRFLFTYIIPLVPFLFLFDGITGVLRSYNDKEKWIMIKAVDGWENYEWEINSKWIWRTAGSFNYVLGYPKK